jgi:3-oxoacyl-[acyl-carrier-protein] synthase II
MERKVVITGIGTVNPLGNSVEESWSRLRAGQHGIDMITHFDASEFEVKLAAQVHDFDPCRRLNRRESLRMARFTQFALYAAAEALEMAGISKEERKPEAGVIVSSGIGGLSVIEKEHLRGMEKGYEKVSPFFIPMTISNMAAARIAIDYGFGGMCSCPVTACAGGNNAIGDAFCRIRGGFEDLMVCGGTEAAITPLGIGGFSSMKALCRAGDPDRASIPFDAERSGFVMGEGAGILVLEEKEHALRRGARILAEVAGYGANCDAYHITAPAPEGTGGAACMKLALKDAGVDPGEIDYINAHGTSTRLNDAGETRAIKTVFGQRAYEIPVSSTKSATGHLLGGAGGVEAVFCVKALEEGFVPPTVGLVKADPECDLDYVPGKGRPAELRYVLSNSLGFGGHNACLIFRRA